MRISLLSSRRQTLQAGFRRQAARRPARTAVVDATGAWSYAEVAARSLDLARRLHDGGLAPGERVALHAHRGAPLVWALLGVLEAGGAFLVLDPDYPAARLAELVRRARPRAWVGLAAAGPPPAELSEALDAGGVRLRIPLDAGPATRTEATTKRPDPGDPLRPAYVAFTSGSTGRPLGVVGDHRAPCHYLAWALRRFGLGPEDRFSLLSGLAHDPLLRDVFIPLWAGATLCIPRREEILAPGRLAAWLAAQRVTAIHLTPALGRLLTRPVDGHRAAGAALLPDLRYAFFGGDVLRGDDVDALASLAPEVRCVSFYGATETPQAAAWYAVPRRSEERPPTAGGLPLGRGIAGVDLLVLDARGRPAAVGEAGEVAVRSHHLATGYLDERALTAGRFLPAPGGRGRRLFRTGDRGRRLAGGGVELLGRLDDQISVRGFRVEPAEVTASLARHPELAQVAVVARTDGSSGARLTAYYVAATPPGPTAAALRADLARRLPEHMLPAAWVRLDALPLTPNGKLDPRRLPPPATAGECVVAPRSPLEEAVASVWEEVLGVDGIGAHDDFFTLGGDSLAAGAASVRLGRLLARELAVELVFTAPTVAALAAAIEGLHPDPLPAGKGEGASPRAAFPPLSSAQRRLWFLARLAPTSTAYHLPAVMHLDGDLEPAALARALAAISLRHGALRTRFPTVDGHPVQVVDRHPPSLQAVDLGHLGVAAGPLAKELARREAARLFDLARGPLLRHCLLRLAPRRHRLLLTLHHAVADGWSQGVIDRELVALYAAFAAGRPSPLPPLALRYVDYTLWQRRRLADDALAEELAYWRRQLAGAPRELALGDRPPPRGRAQRSAARELALPAELVAGLRRCSTEAGTTLFMTLLTGFLVLLGRLTGDTDLVVGTPVANRQRAELEGLVGLFVNLLALRGDLGGDPTFLGLQERVRRIALAAYAHAGLPFEWLVEELAPDRDADRHPLFQVSLTLRGRPPIETETGGLRLRREETPVPDARLELEIHLWARGEALEGVLLYSADRFDASTAGRLTARFARLLAAAAEDPRRPLSRLPLLAAGERQQLLVEWNDDDATYPDAGLGLHQLACRQAARTPEAVAVTASGDTLTYGALARRAGRLAARLRAAGVRPEAVVGLAADRSLAMVAALWGILEAGGAYLPLEAGLPPRRLAFLLADSSATAVVAEARLTPSLAGFDGPALPLADEPHSAAGPVPGPPLSGGAAYLLYTSGSTGEPKGVVIPHRAIVNHMLWMERALPLGAGDRVLQKTPFGFDASVWEIWAPLLAGAELVIAPPGAHREPRSLLALVEERRITVLQVVPSLLRLLVEEPARESGTSLRRVLSGGETLTRELAAATAARWPRSELWNLYGPTEATIHASVARWHGGRVVIGRPVDNADLYVLDRHLRPLPAGSPGELCAGGAGLARGYRGRPGLTAERFVPHPRAAPGGRLYRTGDLARHRRDGCLEHLGRIDHQVKLRGLRVEPGEVEAALRQHRAVADAAVAVRGERLVAFVVPASDRAPAEARRRVEHWRSLYQELYGDPRPPADPRFDTAGWTSSYTGRPIPEDEMRQWLDGIVERIRALRPRRLLEIGCGTGMVLFRLAPDCVRYVASDFSPAVLAGVARHLAADPGLARVELREAAADDFSGLAAGAFDTVVLSSVVQYFPSVDYLMAVLRGVARVTAPGGAIFLGDLRSLPLAGAFYASVEAARADASTPAAELAARVERRRRQEEELLVDPALFSVLAAALPRLRAVSVRPKDGAADNELTRFRYDVALSLDRAPAVPLWTPVKPPAEAVDWTAYTNDPLAAAARRRLGERLREHLASRLPAYLQPASYVVLERMPATASGKLDRRALPADDGAEGSDRPRVAPRTATEQALAAIWRRLLGRSAVGAEDSFFDLGGHSLLAVQAASRVRERWGVEPPLRQIFATPTLGGLAAWIDGARAAADGAARAGRPIPTGERPTEPPPSFAQERLWFLSRLEPESPAYNVPLALELTGPLDAAALGTALNTLVRRHEVLRTRFPEVAGRPVQRVAPARREALGVVDLRGLGGDAPALGHRLAERRGRRPFDLAAEPPLRTALLRTGDAGYLLLLTLHHIASDGASEGVLYRELEALYEALLRGQTPALPGLELQYADYAHWQRRRLTPGLLARLKRYWRRRLSGLTPPEMPTDRPPPAVSQHRGGRCRFALPAGPARALRELGLAVGASPFMVWLALFFVLLARSSGRSDLAVGTPISQRQHRELEPLVGLFVNLLVLRLELAPGESLRQLLKRAREAVLGAFDHQELPFERQVEAMRKYGAAGPGPSLPVTFAVHDAAAAEPRLAGLEVRRRRTAPESARFPLEWHLWENHGDLDGLVQYDAERYDATTVERLWRRFVRLAVGAARAPDKPVGHLELLAPGERQQLVVEWSQGARNDRASGAGGPAPPLVHRLFAAQAACSPEAIAVVTGVEAVSYRWLADRAAAVAHDLAALGLGPEAVVAVDARRAPETIAALFGVLAAGAAYLPLDPADPEERRSALLRESGAKAFAASRRGPQPVPWVDLGCASRQTPWPLRPIDPEQLAYVLYTSGSSGRPKGVMARHLGLANHTADAARAYRLGAGDRVPQLAPLAFDASAEEIYPALTRGATLVLRSEAMLDTPGHLFAAVHRHAFTVLALTTAYWHLVCAEPEAAGDALPPSLRLIVIGGEEAHAAPLARWRRRWGDAVAVVNTYGPTEATVVATRWALTGAPETLTIPVGRAVAGAGTWVLDDRLAPVPAGVVGALHLSGPGLARGYLGRPAATADAFRPRPASAAGERLYRSGDRARWRPDGVLELCGRADRQVKIRGFRVEPGEVEAVLTAHPGVAAAAVVALPAVHGNGAARLVAYLVPAGDAARVPADLAPFLRRRLPPPLLPTTYVALAELPRTARGKLDRSALPAPENGEPGDAGADAATHPLDPLEEMVAGVWAQLLGRAHIGREDDFFQLGGHSLLATQALSRLRSVAGAEISLRAFFTDPTVAGVAARLTAARRTGGGDAATAEPELAARRRPRRVPLSFAQERLWFLAHLEPGNPFYLVSTAWHLAGLVDAAALGRAWGAIVRRHEALRTTLPASRTGVPRQRVHAAGRAPLPQVDLSGLPRERRRRAGDDLVASEQERALDVERGPLCRLVLLRLGGREHLLLTTFHHIVFDGWSEGVFHRELSRLYADFRHRRPPSLTPLPVQYADFALWQRRALGARLDGELDHWRRRLTDLPPCGLTPDRPRSVRPTHHGAERPLRLPAELGAALRRRSREQGSTLYMTLLAAYFALLARHTGGGDLAVGSPIAQRTRRELEGLIGFFVNTLVMRVRLSPELSFRDLAARVRESALDAFDHQDVPFERLVEDLRPERAAGRNPLFTSTFALDNAPARGLALDGLTISRQRLPSCRVRFDLELYLGEGGDGRIEGLFVYATELFDLATIGRFAAHFEALLEALAAPGGDTLRLADLGRLRAAERHQLALEWNDLGGSSRVATTVDRLFLSWAERAPDAVALVVAGAAWSYGEAARRAHRGAAVLRGGGVGPEVLVALCARRSVERTMALMAILVAGGAYLPLDPTAPAERLAWVLEDGDPGVVVSEAPAARRLPSPAGVPRLPLASLVAPANGHSTATPVAPADDPARLAYVTYTSGSTGRPKGVAIPHAGVVRLVAGAGFARLGPDEVFLHLAPLAFDASTLELWGPLANGSRLVVAPAGTPTLGGLAVLLARHRVTTLWLTAGLFHAAVEERIEALAPVRQLLAGGDVLAPATLARALAHLPGTRLVNGYGPTENTTFTCCHVVTNADELWPSVPVGRPVAGTRVHLLDGTLRPVPLGVPAELLTGGDGLARGYHRAPAATAVRFVPDPRPAAPGERLYRTGDRARQRPDGRLELLGRLDRQVKIRGFRVEPAEVEAALAVHPEVAAAAVAVAGDPGDQRLVAGVVPARRGRGTGGDRRERVEHWRALYDDLYRRADGAPNPLPTAGWVSSYDDRPIPAAEMRQWLDGSVERILALAPRRVLEIGCGTGMLVTAIAPSCREYLACDVSPAALELLARRLAAEPERFAAVRLERREATDLGDLPAGGFDTVVLSSVAQYFPDVEYLLRVLRGAMAALATGGSLFVGDLRNLRLADAFHASVALARAAPELPRAELARRYERRREHEEELLVDPRLFAALGCELTRLSAVEVWLKRGSADNELTRFRYDAVLRFDGAPPPEAPALDWRRDRLSADELTRRLAVEAPERLVVHGIRNRRLAGLASLPGRIAGRSGPGTAGELRQALTAAVGEGEDPEALRRLAERSGYAAEASWARGSHRGDFDLLLARHSGGETKALPAAPGPTSLPGPWAAFANDPLRHRRAGDLAERLVAHLAERLPPPAIPDRIQVLDALPLTRNGKPDRAALAAPPARRPAAKAVNGEVPAELAAIWRQVLGGEAASSSDDFFALGGHSLLAVRLLARIERRLGVALPLAELFRHPTLGALARRVAAEAPAAAPPSTRGGNGRSPLAELRPGDALPPLTLVHPAGGNVLCYAALGRRLASGRPLLGLVARGGEGGNGSAAFYHSLDEMLEAYADALLARRTGGPHHLCGWSWGGTVAYELARKLRLRGEKVALVALLDAAPRPAVDGGSPGTAFDLFARQLGLDGGAPACLRALAAGSPRAALSGLGEEARRRGLLPAGVDRDRLRRLYDLFVHNLALLERHSPRSYDGPITLLRPQGDGGSPPNPTLGWGELAATVEVDLVPGDHYSMVREPHAGVLARRLDHHLQRAEGRAAGAPSPGDPPCAGVPSSR